jgi:2-keto-3-deoxy-L-rhamnonate aldolase RhmA
LRQPKASIGFHRTGRFRRQHGHLGNSGCGDVQAAIAYITAICARLGKAVGIYTPDVETAKKCREMGMHFIALHSDVVRLTRAVGTATATMKALK